MTPLTIPNVPTDNLYKFYAITGIIIAIFSVIICVFFLNDIDENLAELEMELDLDDLERVFLQQYYDNFIEERSHLK